MSGPAPGLPRRAFGAAAMAVAGALGLQSLRPSALVNDRRKARSRTAILVADTYECLDEKLVDGLRLFNLELRGKTVLLKPNLVEHIPGAPVNTHPSVVGAAAEAFLRLGAARVVVAEGPGHQRDTQLVLVESGLEQELQLRRLQFVDLNRDELVRVAARTRFTSLGDLWLPRTVLSADAVVSMPKVKTHHWAGVTLSLKNSFGIMPGAAYGWPKNVFHVQGIDRSILDINAAVPVHFVIADGIDAMEGNGPLHGAARPLGRLVLADDPVAADFTCVRLMGLNPWRVPHLTQATRFLGNGATDRIDQLAEPATPSVPSFSVLPEFSALRLKEVL